MGENGQGLRSIIGRYKIDRGMLGKVQAMEKPNNLYAQPMDMNWVGGIAGVKWGIKQRGTKGGNWNNYNSIINKIYLKRKVIKF